IVLQDQLGYRDILVYHRRGYTVFPSFALLQNHRLKNIFLPHLVNGYAFLNMPEASCRCSYYGQKGRP
ncbi:MAG: hypothetical protein NTZ17_19010, partial [Phycisphaerae bacterium]|nr:hypothetical protein [Phycisphaerae bacterium]